MEVEYEMDRDEMNRSDEDELWDKLLHKNVHRQDCEINSSQDEGVGEGIDNEEVRMLNQQHGKSGERGRQYTHAPAVELGANEVDQEDRCDIEYCGCCPADDVDLVVADLFDYCAPEQIAQSTRELLDNFSDDVHQKYGQRAVDEEGVADVVWVEGGGRRIEILAHRLRNLDAGLNHREEAFIGMHMRLAIPVDSNQAQDGCKEQHSNQDDLDGVAAPDGSRIG